MSCCVALGVLWTGYCGPESLGSLLVPVHPYMAIGHVIARYESPTASNETETKLQNLKTQSSSLKVVRLNYLTSADTTLFHIVSFDFEIS